ETARHTSAARFVHWWTTRSPIEPGPNWPTCPHHSTAGVTPMSEAQAIQESSLHFDLAVRRALFHDVLAFFRRRSNDLLPYHEISQRTAPEGESYRGQQTVRLDQIIGSVNRFEEFDRSFMPRRRHARRRWASIDRAWHAGVVLPPVQLIK